MSDAQYDVVGVGNAIVDIMSGVDDAFLGAHGIEKGAMTLIDADRALALTTAFPSPRTISGGSGANSLAGIASFGGKGAYVGKVANDVLGDGFARDIRAIGVAFDSPPLIDGAPTARCLIAVTPDGQRSMNTFLGASTLFGPGDIDPALIAAGKILYLEGYLFDRDEAKAAFVHAAEIARAAGRKVAVTLSDHFCVQRHKAGFRHLIKGHADLVFANEAEILALYDVNTVEAAVEAVRADGAFAAITRSEKGSIIVTGTEVITVPALPTDAVIDTTGAGDMYAAGFLFGWARGYEPEASARLGHLAAREVIGHFGARPETPYAKLALDAGLL
jgi:sugar/nucleoside kinase (ribokinase family)